MGISPGNIASAIPAREDDQVRKQRDLERAQREQAVARSAQATQVGSGGLVVDGGGSITVKDGGSLNIEGSGSINVPSGGLNSAGSITAATTITAGTSMSAGTSVAAGTTVTAAGDIASIAGNMSAAGTVSAGGDIAAAGQITSAGPFVSPGSRATVVTVGYVNAYLDGSGVLGYQPSTRRVKKDLQAVPDELGDALLDLTPYLGRYEWDDASTPLKVFLIAEDVQEAGFGPDVVPLDAEGNPATVNSQNLIPVLLSLLKRQDARIRALELASAGN